MGSDRDAAVARVPLMRTTFASILLVASAVLARAADVAGNAENGRLLLRQYGCGGCHRIPGVEAARGNVGPSLEGIARRVYLAGRLPNTPENMVRWIVEPKAIHPGTAMPDLSVSEAQAHDMVAHLYRLR